MGFRVLAWRAHASRALLAASVVLSALLASARARADAPDLGNDPYEWKYLFPITGTELASKGIRFPFPFGIGLNYLQIVQDVNIDSVEVAVNDAAPDDRYSQIMWRVAKVSILTGAGELEDAERLAREGVALAEQTDWLSDRADTWIQLAAVIERAGRSDEAAEAARTALELYERKGNAVAAARARAQLEQGASS